MVYALLIHSVDSSQSLHFSIFYTPEGNDGNKKTRQQSIIRRILQEHLFQKHSGDQQNTTKSKTPEESDWLFRFTADSKNTSQIGMDYTEGILRLQASSLFQHPKLVVWKQVEQVVYTLVCEPLDNPLLASNFLTYFVAELSDQFRKGSSIADEVAARPDEVLVILNWLLPDGRLIFANNHLRMYWKGEIANMLSR
mmetsp:Transcript_1676/g.3494  ORF Transcript_1676/g.3494 Transcript_1676/m.3494 type:complete len:196 (-) Transcript_1676:298-885(-)